MRAAFVRTLTDLAATDDRILLLTADLGFMALEPFSDAFPERFINVGVAEQNMVGVATGLAEAGYVPFVYSISTFASLRPYEFIRNGPVLHHLPVRIVGIGGGFEYGSAGPTHHGLEDVGVLRMQPGLTVIAPADAQQASTALRSTWNLPGPVFYRFGKDDRAVMPGLDGRFELGRAQTTRDGHDVLFICMGSISGNVAAASDVLCEQGISSTIMVVASVSPAPVPDILEALASNDIAVTVEAHYVTGGLGSLVSEIVAEHGLHTRILRRGICRLPSGRSGSQDYLYSVHGLTPRALAEAAHGALLGRH